MSCYSDDQPPGCDILVTVRCTKVDESGVWGILCDWGPLCSAYLPLGSIGREKGRGERKAQAHFLTNARRECSRGHTFTFVGSVQDVEELSCSSVGDVNGDGSQMSTMFHATLTRRGVSAVDEKDMLDRSTRIRRYGALVDKAANAVGISRLWGRRVAMYEPYNRARNGASQPEMTAIEFSEGIANVPLEETTQVEDLFFKEKQSFHCLVEEYSRTAFARKLHQLLRDEQQHKLKPRVFSDTVSIGGPKAIAKIIWGGTDIKQPNQCSDVAYVRSAIDSAVHLEPPSGCTHVSVCSQGSGKFKFSTKALPEKHSVAQSFLEHAVAHAHDAWKVAITNGSRDPLLKTSENDQLEANPCFMEASMQPSLNIGIIGDVAHGKSTLVRAMTGKRTQAHSSEQQQHGITIKLGFANAAILRCGRRNTCGRCCFFPEEKDSQDATLPVCEHCGFSTEIATRVSFVDCPGHAELMATMLAGISSFDAIVVVAAANAPLPTMQTRQHLEAIRLSGVLNSTAKQQNNIIIAQTKAELVVQVDSKSDNHANSADGGKRLLAHADEGKSALQGTVAAKARYFPVCSPLGVGLEQLATWITTLEENRFSKKEDKTGFTTLNVLRSFDINRPGKPFADFAGGVLGGTIEGPGSICVGDELEVRPGLFIKPKSHHKKRQDGKTKKTKQGSSEVEPPQEEWQAFHVQPLACHCISLFTGKNELRTAFKGGLIGIGTTLCPSLCSNNAQVGAIVGRKGTLPPVWGPALLLDGLQRVCVGAEENLLKCKPQDLSDMLKKQTPIKCHIGSATIRGHVVRVSTRKCKLEVALQAPICARKQSSVAIEAKVGGRSYILVAHARLFGGDLCCDGVNDDEFQVDGESEGHNEGHESQNEIQKYSLNAIVEEGSGDLDEFRRDTFLHELSSVDSHSEIALKLSVPRPLLQRDGGAHIIVQNFGAIATSFRRDPLHLMAFLQKEGGIACAIAGEAHAPSLRIAWRGGRGFSERFSIILKRYGATYVACRQCRGGQTELSKSSSSNKVELVCHRCSARRFVPKLN